MAAIADEHDTPTHLVGIGASAGGLEALERLFRAMPTDTGMAFVVVQHLSPDFKSLMDELLERFTSMPAIPVTDTAQIRPNTIYLLPPRKDITVEGNLLISHDRERDGTLSMPINVFFRSLAASWTDKAIAVVLSGTGTDGSNGIMDVRDAGGMVIVESPETARFDGMPQSAINTGCVDVILPPEEMPKAILSFASDPALRHQYPFGNEEDDTQVGLPSIMKLLKRHYQIDFSNYKPATIMRRIERRVALEIPGSDIEQYSVRLASDSEELNALYKDLLIGVTRFFRDPEVFQYLGESIVPEIIQRAAEDEEIRVWVCGCSTGEESYSIAIVFLEALKKLQRQAKIKILATDIHEDSLNKASEGVYAAEKFSEMPEHLRDEYFEPVGDNNFKVHPNLRKCLIFSSHNVLKDPPFTRMHMVSCRNLLIYFQPSAQARVIATLHYALRLNGIMLLGASETLGDLTEEMETLNRQWKVFRKNRDSGTLLRMRSPMEMGEPKSPRASVAVAGQLSRLYDTLLEKYIPGGILINERREILHIFGDASRYIHPASGRFSGDILSMVSHPISLALSTALRSAEKQMLPVTLKGIHEGGESEATERLTLSVDPLQDKRTNSIFFIIRFEPDLPVKQETGEAPSVSLDLDSEAARQVRELEAELEKMRESLQSTVEELETTNEELQASNEELLASNEELQSTNEELHSVNEELYSVNAEHELKIEELDRVTSDMRNLIQSTDTATIFIDNDFKVRLYTPRALEIFNLIPQDIGRDLRHLQSNLPDHELFADVESVMAESDPIERHVEWEDKQSFIRRCMAYKDVSGKKAGVVINYIDTTSVTLTRQALSESESRFEMILKTVPNAVLMVDQEGLIVMANEYTQTMFGYQPGELAGKSVEVLVGNSLRAAHRQHVAKFFQEPRIRPMSRAMPLLACRKDGSEFDVEVMLAPMHMSGRSYAIAVISDVTERMKTESIRQKALDEALRLAEARSNFLSNMSHEIRTPLNAVIGFSEIGLRNAGNEDKVRNAFGKILSSGNHLMGVINDILDYSKLESGKVTIESIPMNLPQIMDEAIELVKPVAEKKGIQLKTEFGEGLETQVMGDPLRLRQIMLNILSNAVKFTEQGQVSLIAKYDHEQLNLEISDTGVGMTDEQIRKLFQPFEQADASTTRRFGGTGLGLMISKQLLNLMKGEVTVTSQVGIGTTFELSIPCKASSLPMQATTLPELDDVRLNGIRILGVDDVEINRMLLEELLIPAGALLTLASDGQEAVDTVRELGPDAFDIVLMDVMMPNMDGYEATRCIREISPDLPIIGLTAHASSDEAGICKKAGMSDYVSKPFKVHDLIAAIIRNIK